jgi:hypothetical protein
MAAPAPAPAPDPNQAQLDAMEQEAIKDMANAALLVRDAVMAALPVAPEQYITISIPGTVIDTDDIASGGTFVYNVDTEPFTPTAVRQAEAKLVDYMTPLASVMVSTSSCHWLLCWSAKNCRLEILVKASRAAIQRLSIILFLRKQPSRRLTTMLGVLGIRPMMVQ